MEQTSKSENKVIKNENCEVFMNAVIMDRKNWLWKKGQNIVPICKWDDV